MNQTHRSLQRLVARLARSVSRVACVAAACGAAHADTLLRIDRYNPLLGPEQLEVKVSDKVARIDVVSAPDAKTYAIIDLQRRRFQRVDAGGKLVLDAPLDESSGEPRARASLNRGNTGIDFRAAKASTEMHHVSAGTTLCGHALIATRRIEAVDAFLTTMKAVPVKLAGTAVQPQERACQQAAADAMAQLRKLGTLLRYLPSGTTVPERALFNVVEVREVERFAPQTFAVKAGEKPAPADMDGLLKQGFEQAAFDDFLKQLAAAPNIPPERKAAMRKEAEAAHARGEFTAFVERKAKQERATGADRTAR